ncbi:MAG: PleD family two-component system response regulator [Nitrospirota bacterium]
MLLKCVSCEKNIESDVNEINDGSEIRCFNCSTIMKVSIRLDIVNQEVALESTEERSAEEFQREQMAIEEAIREEIPEDTGIEEQVTVEEETIEEDGTEKAAKILIAIEGEFSKDMMKEIIEERGYEILFASNGDEALNIVEKFKPSLAVLDVSLLKIFGFDLCQIIRDREDLKDIKIILLSSIFKKDRYKREPESLFGADDYIERHHIQDELMIKVERLLQKKCDAGAGIGTGRGRDIKEDIEEELEIERDVDLPQSEEIGVIEEVRSQKPEARREKDIKTEQEKVSEEAHKDISGEHKDAKRLARTIISDIAIYNQSKVKEGIKNSTFYEIFRDEIEEGRRLYNSRISPEITKNHNYYKEAIDDFVNKVREQMERKNG